MFKLMVHSDKKSLLYILFGTLASVVTPLLSTVLLKMLIDVIDGGRNLEEVFISVGIYAALCAVFTSASNYFGVKAGSSGGLSRSEAMARILKKSISVSYKNIESRSQRMLLDKANRFIQSSNFGAQTLAQNFKTLLTVSLGIFSCVAIVLYVDFRLVLALLVSGVLTLILFLIASTEEKKINDKIIPLSEKERYLAVGKPCEIKAAKDIRIFNISNWFSPMIDVIAGDRKKLLDKQFAKLSVFNVLTSLIFIMREGLVMYFLISSASSGKISIGDFAFYFGLMNAFTVWLETMAANIGTLKKDAMLCDDYRIFLELDDDAREELAPVKLDLTDAPEIEFKNVKFSYDGEKNVINGISLKVERGEKIAVVGENGAGKTTLMKLLCGLYKPDGGQITINNVDFQAMPLSQQYSLFSAVFQDAFTMPCTIEQNITLSTVPADKQRLERLLEQAGLAEKINSLSEKTDTYINKELNENAVELSGGELQKLFLARALYKDAAVIILDEPTAALDPIAENELYMKFNDMTKGKTSFYISHRLSSTRFCDRIIYLKGGRIAEIGTHDELMSQKGDYYSMYEMQSYYYKEEVGAI